MVRALLVRHFVHIQCFYRPCLEVDSSPRFRTKRRSDVSPQLGSMAGKSLTHAVL